MYMEKVNTTQSEVMAALPLALLDAMVGAENRRMAENGNRRHARFYLQNRLTV